MQPSTVAARDIVLQPTNVIVEVRNVSTVFSTTCVAQDDVKDQGRFFQSETRLVNLTRLRSLLSMRCIV